jgi:hypothetical protein
VLWRIGDRVDQPARANNRTERVKPAAGGGEPAGGDESRCERQCGCTDRDVQEEDVLPPGVAGEKPTGDEPDGRACGSGPAPDPTLLRSAPSSNMVITIERAAGTMIAAPTP